MSKPNPDDNQSLELHAGTAVAPAHELSLIEVIAAAARDPQVDVAKMTALVELKERIDRIEAEKAYNEAMNRLQAKLPRVVRRREITVKGTVRSKYAAFEDIDQVARPLMIEEGFSASYTTEEKGPKETQVTCTIRHVRGHKEHFSVTVPFDRNEYRSDAQCQGSTISYGKRYAFCLGLNITIVGEDNDGITVGFVTDQQLDAIMDLMGRVGMDRDPRMEAKFLEYMGAKAPREIQARDFQKAITALENKRRQVHR